jgi:NAD+ synthase (glutamine-hydrolysing)
VNATGVQNNGKDFIVFDGSSTVYNEVGSVAHAVPPYANGVEDFVLDAHLPEAPHTEASDVTQLWNGIERGLRGFIETVPPHMRKAVVGLSGGIDSAVVAALMVHVLGKENVIGITMPYGDYNSAETRANARSVAEALGISFEVRPIDALVDAQATMHDMAPGTSPFKTVQAIARMTVLAARAGAVNGFFTSNGNKSELAFGYYTLNGDGRGAIAPLGDLLKGEVYQLAHYMNTVVFGREVIPRAVIDVAPMDELGPQGSGVRKDPFDYGHITPEGVFVRGYHDAMVHAIVGFRKDAEWFLDCYLQGTLERELGLNEGTIASLFATSHDFVADLERCFALFSNATWKRVQSVPLILVSKRAFGWDYRESVLPPFRSTRYEELKRALLGQGA